MQVLLSTQWESHTRLLEEGTKHFLQYFAGVVLYV